jgi:hypothetical protein
MLVTVLIVIGFRILHFACSHRTALSWCAYHFSVSSAQRSLVLNPPL